MTRHFNQVAMMIVLAAIVTGCSAPLVETNPEIIDVNKPVTITVNAEKGNKGLLGWKYPVYVHIGLITDSSRHPRDWRYTKFNWGSTEEAALAKKVGDNMWSYTVPNIRDFFGVRPGENPLHLAVLFRQGNCFDTLCKVLREENGSDIFIPIGKPTTE